MGNVWLWHVVYIVLTRSSYWLISVYVSDDNYDTCDGNIMISNVLCRNDNNDNNSIFLTHLLYMHVEIQCSEASQKHRIVPVMDTSRNYTYKLIYVLSLIKNKFDINPLFFGFVLDWKEYVNFLIESIYAYKPDTKTCDSSCRFRISSDPAINDIPIYRNWFYHKQR